MPATASLTEYFQKLMNQGADYAAPKALTISSVPRISRLMALSIHMRELIDTGEVADYAEFARISYVSRARITQIMNLSLLAPDIQEELLHLPPSHGGRDSVSEKAIRPIAALPDWRKQRRMWEEIIMSSDGR